MDLLERYLAQINRFLPKKDREDTINELRSLLLENYDSKLLEIPDQDQAMVEVIKEFGNPRHVAIEYKNEQPLLSKEIEPLAFLIMKITAISVPLAILFGKTIEFLERASFTTMELILEYAYTIPSILSSLFSTLAMMLLVFMIIDRKFGSKMNLKKVEFDPKNLPPIPTETLKISHFETIFNILGGVLFLYLMNFQPGLIAVYYEDVREPLLNSNFEHILPFINISVFISIGYHISYIVKGRKTKVTSTVEFAQTVFAGILLFVLASTDIFNPIIIEGYDLSIVPQILRIIMIIGGITTIIGGLVKYIKILLSTTSREDIIVYKVNK